MAAGKHDVEMAKVNRSMAIWHRVIGNVSVLAWIVASWIPLQVVNSMVAKVAGKETIVQTNVVFSFGLSISIVTNIGLAAKALQQRQSLKEQRARLDHFEAQSGL